MYGFSADLVESISALGEVSAVLNQSNVVISGPTLSLDFPRSYGTTYYEEFTVNRNDIPLFEKVERITITSTSKPLYYQMNDFLPGVTYIFESENGVYAWHPGCERERFANYSENYRVFLFNGTDKNAKPLGNLAHRLNADGECRNGLELLRGLIIIAVKPLNFSNPELSKLLIMDKSVVDKFYPMSLFFFDWAWGNGYFRYVTYAGAIFADDDGNIMPTYFVMINYEEYVKYDCILVGLGNAHLLKNEPMPLIEVYTGWPIDIQANRSNLIATYSQGNRYTNLPQRFQGPVFTFVVWQPTSAADVGPLFANPTANGTILYRSIGGMNPIFSYKGRPILDFEPFNGRHGIIRNDWQDGKPGVLELYENVNATVFNFTFFFEPDCDPAAILFVTISSNLTSTNHTLPCNNSTSLELRASNLSARLYGRAVARYFVSGCSR